MSDGRTHWEGCWKTYGHMDCAVAKVEQLEEKLKRNNCQKTVEKLGNRIEKRDAKIVKLQQRIKKLEESGADMLAQIDFG